LNQWFQPNDLSTVKKTNTVANVKIVPAVLLHHEAK